MVNNEIFYTYGVAEYNFYNDPIIIGKAWPTDRVIIRLYIREFGVPVGYTEVFLTLEDLMMYRNWDTIPHEIISLNGKESLIAELLATDRYIEKGNK